MKRSLIPTIETALKKEINAVPIYSDIYGIFIQIYKEPNNSEELFVLLFYSFVKPKS